MNNKIAFHFSKCISNLRLLGKFETKNVYKYFPAQIVSANQYRPSSSTVRNESSLKEKLINKFKLPAESANFVVLKLEILNEKHDKNSSSFLGCSDEKLSIIKENFQPVDILHNLKVFVVPEDELSMKIEILKEIGLDNLEIRYLDLMPYLVSQTIRDLKQNHIYPKNNDPYRSFVQTLIRKKVLSENCDLLNEKSDVIPNIDLLTVRQVRLKLLNLIVKHVLSCSDLVAVHIVDLINAQKNFDKVSLLSLVSNINSYINEINLPINKLIKNFASISTSSSENIRSLATIDHFKKDYNLRCSFFSRQKLIQIDSNQIQKRLDLLINKYKCTYSQLANSIFILELSTDQINDRFKKFNESSQLKTYSRSNEILRVIYNLDTILENISVLNDRQISLKHITLNNLLKQDTKFINMVNSNTFKLTLSSFIQLHFNRQLKDVRSQIGQFRLSHKPLNSFNAANVVNFFRDEGLSDEQILNGIYLIFFDFNQVKSTWNEMFVYPEMQANNNVVEWKHHPLVLQLVVYFLEKFKN